MRPPPPPSYHSTQPLPVALDAWEDVSSPLLDDVMPYRHVIIGDVIPVLCSGELLCSIVLRLRRFETLSPSDVDDRVNEPRLSSAAACAPVRNNITSQRKICSMLCGHAMPEYTRLQCLREEFPDSNNLSNSRVFVCANSFCSTGPKLRRDDVVCANPLPGRLFQFRHLT